MTTSSSHAWRKPWRWPIRSPHPCPASRPVASQDPQVLVLQLPTMSSSAIPPDLVLPTLDVLDVPSPTADVDAHAIANAWFAAFSSALLPAPATHDPDALLDLFLPAPDPFWRDVLALTGSLRTFRGRAAIGSLVLQTAAPGSDADGSSVGLTSLRLDPHLILLVRPYPDLVFVQAAFAFATRAGRGTGVFRLVPVPGGAWKAYTVFTALEGLHGVPESIERGLPASEPDVKAEVAIVGGGHCGLGLAARLKALGVNAVVLEKHARVGDGWRGRYEVLRLQDPAWYDHLPYIPFTPSWPVHATGAQLADWLERYASDLALNVQTSTTVTRAAQDARTKRWTLTLRRDAGSTDSTGGPTTATLEVRDVVFAVGLGGGTPFVPDVRGKEAFQGALLHSSEFTSAREYIGKRVVVVGAGTSAHDVAADCIACGVDVTMCQRSPTYVMSAKNGFEILLGDLYAANGPPTELADLLNISLPTPVLHLLAQRKTAAIAAADREMLEALRARGFLLDAGMGGSGVFLQTLVRGGGYYLDVGAATLIAEGKIKLRRGAAQELVPRGVLLDRGEGEADVVPADVVVFATGYTTARAPLAQICGPDVADAIGPVWNLDAEGEVRGVWRDVGVAGLYVMMGNLALSRIYSKYLALQIKARAMGVLPRERVKAEERGLGKA
ncbi:hypothetical protein OF83DRAFT_93853 [Amylostereum chailletii]|nr:hypothetical protein OF83DRAFT_93853 [Amylostereum chailletii]